MKATGPHQPAEFSGLYELGMYLFVFGATEIIGVACCSS